MVEGSGSSPTGFEVTDRNPYRGLVSPPVESSQSGKGPLRVITKVTGGYWWVVVTPFRDPGVLKYPVRQGP